MSSLDSSSGDSPNKVLLQAEEENETGNEGKHRHGEQTSPRRDSRRVQEKAKTQRNREEFRAGQIEQLVKEIIPCPEEREEHRRNESWNGEGHENPQIDGELPTTVDHRRFIELFWKPTDKLNEQKDEKRISCQHLRNNKRQECIDPAKTVKEDVTRNRSDV